MKEPKHASSTETDRGIIEGLEERGATLAVADNQQASHIVFEFKEPEPHKLRRLASKAFPIAFAVVAVSSVILGGSHLIATAPMTSIADKLHPHSDWAKEGDRVAGGAFCVNNSEVPCDSLSRSYRSETLITHEDIQKIIDASGLNLSIQGTCEPRVLPKVTDSPYTECFASGVAGGYDVTIKAGQVSKNSPATNVTFGVSKVANRWK